MDEEDRCSDEEYAEAYKEWLWLRDIKEQDEEMERKLEQADLRRKELIEEKL